MAKSKNKVCGICRAAKLRASWACRACGRMVCEHLCGYATVYDALPDECDVGAW